MRTFKVSRHATIRATDEGDAVKKLLEWDSSYAFRKVVEMERARGLVPEVEETSTMVEVKE